MTTARLSRPNDQTLYGFLGLHGTAPDEALSKQVEFCLSAVMESAVPRACWRILPFTEALDGIHPKGTGLVLTGTDIHKHLSGCDTLLMMAATIGMGTERLLKKASDEDLASSVITDACAGAVIETVCDNLESDLRADLKNRGLYLTGRFSPGYGDLPLTLQRELLSVLDAGRKIGLTVTESGIMVPRKSVTAILGISSVPVTGHRAGCDTCIRRGKCKNFKEGKTCES